MPHGDSEAPAPDPVSLGEVQGPRYAFGFAVLNALSFQIVLGTPMILFAKRLGAGD